MYSLTWHCDFFWAAYHDVILTSQHFVLNGLGLSAQSCNPGSNFLRVCPLYSSWHHHHLSNWELTMDVFQSLRRLNSGKTYWTVPPHLKVHFMLQLTKPKTYNCEKRNLKGVANVCQGTAPYNGTLMFGHHMCQEGAHSFLPSPFYVVPLIQVFAWNEE